MVESTGYRFFDGDVLPENISDSAVYDFLEHCVWLTEVGFHFFGYHGLSDHLRVALHMHPVFYGVIYARVRMWIYYHLPEAQDILASGPASEDTLEMLAISMNAIDVTNMQMIK